MCDPAICPASATAFGCVVLNVTEQVCPQHGTSDGIVASKLDELSRGITLRGLRYLINLINQPHIKSIVPPCIFVGHSQPKYPFNFTLLAVTVNRTFSTSVCVMLTFVTRSRAVLSCDWRGVQVALDWIVAGQLDGGEHTVTLYSIPDHSYRFRRGSLRNVDLNARRMTDDVIKQNVRIQGVENYVKITNVTDTQFLVR
jgi:hypothetical protein